MADHCFSRRSVGLRSVHKTLGVYGLCGAVWVGSILRNAFGAVWFVAFAAGLKMLPKECVLIPHRYATRLRRRFVLDGAIYCIKEERKSCCGQFKKTKISF